MTVSLTQIAVAVIGVVVLGILAFLQDSIKDGLKSLGRLLPRTAALESSVKSLKAENAELKASQAALAAQLEQGEKQGGVVLALYRDIERGLADLCHALSASRGSIYVPVRSEVRQPVGLVYLCLYPFDVGSERLKADVVPLAGSHAGRAFTTAEALLRPREAPQPGYHNVADQRSSFQTQDMMTLPVACNEQVIAVVQLLNQRSDSGFTQADLARAGAVIRALGDKLTAFVADERNLAELGAFRLPLTMVTAAYFDLTRSSSLYGSALGIDGSVSLINDVFALIGQIASRHGGTIDNYVGDGVLLRFNQPVPVANHPSRALHACLDIQEAYANLVTEPGKEPLRALTLRCGISTGLAKFCAVGHNLNQQWRVTGPVPSIAALLSQVAPRERSSVLIDQTVRGSLDPTDPRVAARPFALDPPDKALANDARAKLGQLTTAVYEVHTGA